MTQKNIIKEYQPNIYYTNNVSAMNLSVYKFPKYT